MENESNMEMFDHEYFEDELRRRIKLYITNKELEDIRNERSASEIIENMKKEYKVECDRLGHKLASRYKLYLKITLLNIFVFAIIWFLFYATTDCMISDLFYFILILLAFTIAAYYFGKYMIPYILVGCVYLFFDTIHELLDSSHMSIWKRYSNYRINEKIDTWCDMNRGDKLVPYVRKYRGKVFKQI